MPETKVLIIDDSTELRALLESILPYSGYRAIGASTGKEGVSLALGLHPDVILLDLELPDITGLQVLEALNQHKLTIPTIMITGYGSESVAARALRLGAHSYLVKPFTTEEVLTSLERAMTVRRLHLEKVHLTTQLQDYARHFRTISAISQALLGGLDLDQFLRRIVEAALYVTRAERCLLSLQDATSQQFGVVEALGKACQRDCHFSSTTGDERLRAVLEKGVSVRCQASPGSTIALQTGDTARAVLQVPLRTRYRIVGLLSADRQDSVVPFGKHDERMLSILADYVVFALERNGQIDE